MNLALDGLITDEEHEEHEHSDEDKPYNMLSLTYVEAVMRRGMHCAFKLQVQVVNAFVKAMGLQSTWPLRNTEPVALIFIQMLANGLLVSKRSKLTTRFACCDRKFQANRKN